MRWAYGAVAGGWAAVQDEEMGFPHQDWVIKCDGVALFAVEGGTYQIMQHIVDACNEKDERDGGVFRIAKQFCERCDTYECEHAHAEALT